MEEYLEHTHTHIYIFRATLKEDKQEAIKGLLSTAVGKAPTSKQRER